MHASNRFYTEAQDKLYERQEALNRAEFQRDELRAEIERLREFADLVIDMRAAQKAYFRDRKQSDLVESKRLEKLVDQWPPATLW
jgi:hypothetical protein